jgi:nucleoid DNA-binding protein
MAKTAKKKPFKPAPASKRRSRGDVIKQIAAATDLKTGKVREVFEALTVPDRCRPQQEGCWRIQFQRPDEAQDRHKPATSARKGRNPFTGEEIMIKAKPRAARSRVRALRNLNGLI